MIIWRRSLILIKLDMGQKKQTILIPHAKRPLRPKFVPQNFQKSAERPQSCSQCRMRRRSRPKTLNLIAPFYRCIVWAYYYAMRIEQTENQYLSYKVRKNINRSQRGIVMFLEDDLEPA